MSERKKFIILANMQAVCYKEVFPLIKNNEIRLGARDGHNMTFQTTTGMVDITAYWLTNMHHDVMPKLTLTKRYTPEEYPKYDNMDAINVKRVSDIPMDYEGVMGVPLSYIERHDATKYDIITIACGNSWKNYKEDLTSLNFNHDIKYGGGLGTAVLNGKGVYTRILIRKK